MMRIRELVVTAAVVAGLSGTAFAQSAAQVAHSGIETADHWYASGYLGPNFGSGGSVALTNLNTVRGANGDEIERGSQMGINFGGELGYAFGGRFGAEFMANYAPNFQLNDTLLQRRPSVSSYMFNGLVLVPTSGEHRFSPFLSGGIGAIRMQSTIFTVDPGTTVVNVNTLQTQSVGGTNFGWDIGGGLFAFSGPWGLRADVRYYKATTGTNNIADVTVGNVFLQRELSGLSFWNANFGVAFRW